MKRKLVSILLILALTASLTCSAVFADPEDGDYEGSGDGEYYEGEYYEDTWDESYSEESWDDGSAAPDGGTYPDPGALDVEPVVVMAERGENQWRDWSEPPEIKSGAGIVYCRNIGEVIYSKDADVRYSPYSITKLLTALLAVQKLPLDRVITVSEEAAAQDGSSMELKAGEQVTVEQLLCGTLILSGNDAAYALAEAACGTCDEFVALMNTTCANIGCKNTRFVNPNGLIDDVSEQYTTARDMLAIAKLAFANDTVRRIAGLLTYEMPATNMSEAYTMTGHNELMSYGKRCYTAGKTGYFNGRATIVMDYQEKGLELITVILGSNIDDRGIDTDDMVEYALANVEGYQVVKAGENVGKVRVYHGAKTRTDAFTADECRVYLPKQGSKELINTKIVMDPDVEAPVAKGDVVGKFQVYVAGEMVNEVDLISNEDIEVGWFPSYIGISNQTSVIALGVATFVLALIVLRIVNKTRSRIRRKKAHKALVREMAREELRRRNGVR